MSDTALGAGMMEGGRKVVERMAGIKPLQFIKNNPGKVLGGGGLLTVLAAASELEMMIRLSRTFCKLLAESLDQLALAPQVLFLLETH